MEGPGKFRLPSGCKVSLSKSLPVLGPQFPLLQDGRKARGLTMLCLEMWVEVWSGGPTALKVGLITHAQLVLGDREDP